MSDTPEDEVMRYDLWVEAALRRVIHQALDHAATSGLSGDHHFYISFLTRDEGVKIPARLLAQHPNEMTIVLQYQFEDLKVSDEGFGVTLSFGGKKERLEIPFSSVISFSDPSVSFALQLKMMPLDDEDGELDEDIGESEIMDFAPDTGAKSHDEEKTSDNTGDDGAEKTGEVITLDAFRKK